MKRITRIVAAVVCVSLVLGGSAVLVRAAESEKKDSEHEKYLQELIKEAEIRKQANMKLAEHYFTTGKKRFDERRFKEAEADFEQALVANRNHAKAKEYLARARRILGKAPSGEGMLDQVALRKQVEWGYQRAKMLKAAADARALMRQNNFDRALEKLDEARGLAKILATRLDVTRELNEINALTTQADAARKKAEQETDRLKIARASELAESDRLRLEDLHRQRIARLFEDAQELYKDTRYLLAARKAEEILRIEPRNKEVMAFRDKCYDMQVAQDVKWYERTKEVETARTWRATRKEAIPYTQWQPLYPDDWDEKRKRTAGIQIEMESEAEQKWKKELKEKLEKPVSFDFVATPLDDVVAFLRQLARVNIVVDKRAVENRGSLDVTLRLDQMKLKKALGWILRLVDLKYTLKDEAIFISTEENIDKDRNTVTRFYEVTDLTLEIRNFKPDLTAISSGGLDIDEMDDIFSEQDDEGETEADTFTGDSLVEFIKEVIAPGTWADIAAGDDFM